MAWEKTGVVDGKREVVKKMGTRQKTSVDGRGKSRLRRFRDKFEHLTRNYSANKLLFVRD